MGETETQSPAQKRAGGAAQPCLVVVLQGRQPTTMPARIRLETSIEIGRGSELSLRSEQRRARLEIADPVMSSKHARISGVADGFIVEDLGSKNGTRVNGARTSHAVLRDGDWIETGDTLLRFRSAFASSSDEPCVRTTDSTLATIVPGLAGTFGRIALVAKSNVPLLVFGETGTGKELVARAFHELSERSGAFVAVNCGAVASSLIESELFGHRKGAFSGATDDRVGFIRSADGGTLFLDEIGELPAAAQAALLRVLQEREVIPVGGDRALRVDIQLVAATHRDLEHQASFREDLYGRLAGQIVCLPPLRDRLEDIGLIVGRLLRKLGKPDATIEIEAARALARYRWPRNVRELELALASALAVDPQRIELANLPDAIVDDSPRLERDTDAERRHQLEALLVEHRGNVSRVAEAMGKARSLVQKWLHRYGLDPETYRR